ncbi:aldo/keto reductase [Scytonema sp. PCC 10023]|uniref:aldo/keto reductase n=1 Tax=Scytonema sp. PCC 10023 TaxID=1680591 RepID=UPI0039C5CEA2
MADTVVQVAEEIGRKPSQVAINWVRSKGVIPILGATKLSQIQDNLACLDFQLSPEHIQKLDELRRQKYEGRRQKASPRMNSGDLIKLLRVYFSP